MEVSRGPSFCLNPPSEEVKGVTDDHWLLPTRKGISRGQQPGPSHRGLPKGPQWTEIFI
jgi:hypothetical protein